MTSFRPRPIDIDKPLLIVRKELTDEEARPMPALSTGMETHEENESHIRNAILEAQRKNTRIIADIPTPIVKTVSTYEMESEEWTQPTSYIKVTPSVHPSFRDPFEEPIEYDIDSDDEQWISDRSSKYGASFKIIYEDFELIIDTFEKALAREQMIAIKSKDAKLSLHNAIDSIREIDREFSDQILIEIYEYWIQKRDKQNKPLLLSLVPPPAYDDPSPLIPFRPRERESKKKPKKRNDDVYEQLKRFKQELEKGRSLLKKIQQREKLKRDHLLQSQRLFNLRTIKKERDIQYFNANPKTKENSKLNQLYSFAESSGEEDSDNEEMQLLSDEEDEEEESDHSDVENEYCPWDRYPEHIHNSETNPENECYWGTIQIPNIPQFRGRVRMGRGGRVFIDRASTRVPNQNKEPAPILWY